MGSIIHGAIKMPPSRRTSWDSRVSSSYLFALIQLGVFTCLPGFTLSGPCECRISGARCDPGWQLRSWRARIHDVDTTSCSQLLVDSIISMSLTKRPELSSPLKSHDGEPETETAVHENWRDRVMRMEETVAVRIRKVCERLRRAPDGRISSPSDAVHSHVRNIEAFSDPIDKDRTGEDSAPTRGESGSSVPTALNVQVGPSSVRDGGAARTRTLAVVSSGPSQGIPLSSALAAAPTIGAAATHPDRSHAAIAEVAPVRHTSPCDLSVAARGGPWRWAATYTAAGAARCWSYLSRRRVPRPWVSLVLACFGGGRAHEHALATSSGEIYLSMSHPGPPFLPQPRRQSRLPAPHSGRPRKSA